MQTYDHPFRTVLPPLPPAPANGAVQIAEVQPAGLVTCSICLSVRRGSQWIDAEVAIRELRSYESREPVRLAHGLCDDCNEDVAGRRGRAANAA
jgi:NMD protein affecting ribosome stability and mRNA decay